MSLKPTYSHIPTNASQEDLADMSPMGSPYKPMFLAEAHMRGPYQDDGQIQTIMEEDEVRRTTIAISI
jgi:hypothetical protein